MCDIREIPQIYFGHEVNITQLLYWNFLLNYQVPFCTAEYSVYCKFLPYWLPYHTYFSVRLFFESVLVLPSHFRCICGPSFLVSFPGSSSSAGPSHAEWVLALVPWLSLAPLCLVSVWDAVPCGHTVWMLMVFLPYSLASPSPLSDGSACVSFILPFIQWSVSSLCAWNHFQVLGYRVEQDMVFSWGRWAAALTNFRGLLLLGRREVLAERLSSLRSLWSSDLVESPPCRGPFVGHTLCPQGAVSSFESSAEVASAFSCQPLPTPPLTWSASPNSTVYRAEHQCLVPLLLASEWIFFCLVSFSLSSSLSDCLFFRRELGCQPWDTFHDTCRMGLVSPQSSSVLTLLGQLRCRVIFTVLSLCVAGI